MNEKKIEDLKTKTAQKAVKDEKVAKTDNSCEDSELGFFRPLFNLFTDDFAPEFHGPVNLMKTDIKEEAKDYRLDIEVPGVEKKDIKVSLEDGYLNVSATVNKDVKEGSGKAVHTERFAGSYSRSYYVGNRVKKSDIAASVNNGVLTLLVPKTDEKEDEAEKYIEIK
jgi:HSP20 family protein